MELFEQLLLGEGANKAKFLHLQSEITEAFEAGYTRKQIWEHLRNKRNFTCSYATFCRYVQKFITKKVAESPGVKHHRLHREKLERELKEGEKEKPKKFDWSPNYDPKDLIGE